MNTGRKHEFTSSSSLLSSHRRLNQSYNSSNNKDNDKYKDKDKKKKKTTTRGW